MVMLLKAAASYTPNFGLQMKNRHCWRFSEIRLALLSHRCCVNLPLLHRHWVGIAKMEIKVKAAKCHISYGFASSIDK
jgi:hypothetical protein